MPRRPLRPCAYPGCPALVRSGRCEIHAATAAPPPPPKPKRRSPFYGSARWLRTRASYLHRHPCCERCGAAATIVHHRRAWQDGGPRYDDENLESLCARCHGQHHNYGRR